MPPSRVPRALRGVAFLALVLPFLAGCGSTGPAAGSGMPGESAILSVERFLHAVSAGDLESMAEIFGTEDGPIIAQAGGSFGCAFRRMGSWIGLSRRCVSPQEIELRMNAIALILEHDEFEVVSEGRVAGRRNPTVRVGVDVARGNRTVSDVPFVVVEARNGLWFIEEIGLERVTRQ